MVVAAITLLLTVGLGRVASKYVRVDVRYNEQMLQRTWFERILQYRNRLRS